MRLNFPSLPIVQRNSRARRTIRARDAKIRKWPLETMTQKITRWLIRRPFLVAHTGAEERIQDTFTGAKSLLPSLTQSVSSTGGKKAPFARSMRILESGLSSGCIKSGNELSSLFTLGNSPSCSPSSPCFDV